MKKFFTLTLTLIILSTAAFSQTIVSRVAIKTPNFSIDFNRGYGNQYSFTPNERDQRIHSINSVYNQQVSSVMKLRIGYAKQMDLIHQLQIDKANRLADVDARFFNAKNVSWNGRRFDDDAYEHHDQYNQPYYQQNSPYQHYDGYTR